MSKRTHSNVNGVAHAPPGGRRVVPFDVEYDVEASWLSVETFASTEQVVSVRVRAGLRFQTIRLKFYFVCVCVCARGGIVFSYFFFFSVESISFLLCAIWNGWPCLVLTFCAKTRIWNLAGAIQWEFFVERKSDYCCPITRRQFLFFVVEQSAVINPNEEKKRKGHTTRPIVISYRFAVKEVKQKAERLDGKPKRKL